MGKRPGKMFTLGSLSFAIFRSFAARSSHGGFAKPKRKKSR
jgi:hypothetical protein